jgi:hypothetical protein
MIAGAATPRATKGLTCPLHKKDMSLVCHKCPWWTYIRGKHPQSDENIDRWNCAIGFLPMLLIENTQVQFGTGAAIESMRNESVISLRDLGAAVQGSVQVMLDEASRERQATVATVKGAVTALIGSDRLGLPKA